MDDVILESIVTTTNAEGHVNLAPMGPQVGEHPQCNWKRFILKPFTSSTTYTNLSASGAAVIHVTDDVSLFARAAIDTIEHHEAVEKYLQRIDDAPRWALRDCHRWFSIEVESQVVDGPRAEMVCRVVESRIVRPFFGFNRAKHAVIEAAILATRVHLIPAASLLEQLELLQPLVDKTGGAAEREAFDMLQKTIHARISLQT